MSRIRVPFASGYFIVLHAPVFIGSIITGYIVRRKSWIFGLLLAIITDGAIWYANIGEWYNLRDNYFYKTLRGNFLSVTMVLSAITLLIVGAAGGYLGGLLAQMRLKKIQKKRVE